MPECDYCHEEGRETEATWYADAEEGIVARACDDHKDRMYDQFGGDDVEVRPYDPTAGKGG